MALSDATRRGILARLAEGEARVTEIAAPLAMSLNGASKHIKVLERAGLIRRRVRGRDHFISVAPGGLDGAAAWIDETRRFWQGRLDNLAALFADSATGSEQS